MRRHIWLLAMQTFIFLPQKSKLFIIRQGHVAWRSSFFPETLKLLDLYIIWHVCTEQVLLILCHCRYRCFSAGFYEATFLISSFALIDCVFLITSVCLTHPITLRLSPLAPSPRCLSLFRSTLGALNILASSHFLLPPRPSVRWEN